MWKIFHPNFGWIFYPSNQGQLVGEQGVNDHVGRLVSKQPTCEHTLNDLTLKIGPKKIIFNSFLFSFWIPLDIYIFHIQSQIGKPFAPLSF